MAEKTPLIEALQSQVDQQAEQIEALKAELLEDAEICDHWRQLALQFDRHRMQALAHLRLVVSDPEGGLEDCRSFLAEAPVQGHELTAELDQLRSENASLRTAFADCIQSLHEEMLGKYQGQQPDDMHPVTWRQYHRDMKEIEDFKAILIGKESAHSPSTPPEN